MRSNETMYLGEKGTGTVPDRITRWQKERLLIEWAIRGAIATALAVLAGIALTG